MHRPRVYDASIVWVFVDDLYSFWVGGGCVVHTFLLKIYCKNRKKNAKFAVALYIMKACVWLCRFRPKIWQHCINSSIKKGSHFVEQRRQLRRIIPQTAKLFMFTLLPRQSFYPFQVVQLNLIVLVPNNSLCSFSTQLLVPPPPPLYPGRFLLIMNV